jgi:hypothetical protein
MEKDQHKFVFDRSNFILLFIGLGLNVLGFLLMIGGAAESLDDFNEKELFSPIRITVAPILIILGYIVIGYGIMKKNKPTDKDASQ